MFKKITLSIFLTLLLGLPISVGATGLTDLQTNLGNFGGQVGYDSSDSDLTGKIALIINIVLGFLGLLAVVMIIFAGFNWMTAGGNEETVTKAKGTIKNAVIGIAIVLSAFVIVNFTVSQLSDTTSENNSGGATTGGTVPTDPLGTCNYQKKPLLRECKEETRTNVTEVKCRELHNFNKCGGAFEWTEY